MEKPACKTVQVTFPTVLYLSYSLVIENKKMKKSKDTDIKPLWWVDYALTLPLIPTIWKYWRNATGRSKILVQSIPNHNACLPTDIILEFMNHMST